MFDVPHGAPLERGIFLSFGHKHLAALRPRAKQHTITPLLTPGNSKTKSATIREFRG
jgi:hypothetical protein